MSAAGNPDYNKGRRITIQELESMSVNELIYSYTIIKCEFSFPGIKYPSIPCYTDETTICFPLSGKGIITGSEYLLAKNQGCALTIEEVYYIPFERGDNGPINHPFKEVIKELQTKRREHSKGTLLNALYKDLANCIYGIVVKGMSNKLRFDTETRTTKRMDAGELSNPIISS
jgi:hypothetical protein